MMNDDMPIPLCGRRKQGLVLGEGCGIGQDGTQAYCRHNGFRRNLRPVERFFGSLVVRIKVGVCYRALDRNILCNAIEMDGKSTASSKLCSGSDLARIEPHRRKVCLYMRSTVLFGGTPVRKKSFRSPSIDLALLLTARRYRQSAMSPNPSCSPAHIFLRRSGAECEAGLRYFIACAHQGA